MEKIYLMIGILFLIVVVSAYYIQAIGTTTKNIGNETEEFTQNLSLVGQEGCDELMEQESIEFKKLDFNCQMDEDCILIDVRCGICVNINVNATRYMKIYYDMLQKSCVPLVDCLPTECKCINNKCETHRTIHSE
ncbi:MAG: hypothetical protein OH319_02165 [Candidatus Parvarchaeota archaeon]|nr:hypothetical protein [Candidatus Jingweiarchaeum tengchongense]MCW1298173.1 hypothetical protein [Candidatus Jingweiarchaeum tengchongense]MCW1299971.1 hypothetical protein [Candidatus Jingweiarchaeum tengchongense]MCW1305480.1 hypothetical protein [Candidatus Jingweiarchaeum tengchongense]MCW1310412.1 hypothetical protein [Candidatus Jingweiarchaeum tengchongense]